MLRNQFEAGTVATGQVLGLAAALKDTQHSLRHGVLPKAGHAISGRVLRLCTRCLCVPVQPPQWVPGMLIRQIQQLLLLGVWQAGLAIRGQVLRLGEGRVRVPVQQLRGRPGLGGLLAVPEDRRGALPAGAHLAAAHPANINDACVVTCGGNALRPGRVRPEQHTSLWCILWHFTTAPCSVRCLHPTLIFSRLLSGRQELVSAQQGGGGRRGVPGVRLGQCHLGRRRAARLLDQQQRAPVGCRGAPAFPSLSTKTARMGSV